MNTVYLDHASATPTDPRVIEAMLPYLKTHFGNPSSLHRFGHDAARALSAARQEIAEFLSAKPDEIYFTSSGTESNNLAILGVTRANQKLGRIVTTKLEHPSVLNACISAQRSGNVVIYIESDQSGVVDPHKIANQVNHETILVTTHLANSEIGVVQDIDAISKAVKQKNPQTLIHVDACQAAAVLSLNVDELGVDLLSFNGSKAYGPKGVAVLFVRTGTPIFPIIFGGGQEKSLRSGTENVAAIVGLSEAVKVIKSTSVGDVKRISELRNELQFILSQMKGVTINVPKSHRLPNHLSVRIEDGPTDLVEAFDKAGICLSAGSACSSRSLTESHVLSAIGLSSHQANRTVRITLGRSTTKPDTTRLIETINNFGEKRPGTISGSQTRFT